MLLGTNQGWIHFSNSALSTGSETEWDRARPRFGSVSDIRFDPQNPDVAYAVYSTFNNDPDIGHVFKTTDGGATWASIDGPSGTGLPDLPFDSVAVHPQDSNTIFAGSDLGLFISNDGGANWTFDPALPSAPLYSLQFAENNGPVLFAFTYGRGLFRQRLSSDPPCSYAIAGSTSIPAYGGTTTNQLTAGAGCPWSGFSLTGSFFTMPVSVGTGSGRLTFSTTLNDTTLARTASFQIGTATHKVTQARPEFPVVATAATGATPITAAPYVSVQDTRPAVANPDNPVHTCTGSRDAKSAWFRYTANGAAKMAITARGVRYDNSANYGMVIAVYARTAAGEAGAELACSAQNTGGTSFFSTVNVTPTAGQQLLIQVSGRGTDSPGGYTVLAVNQ